jgi:hypothetical protein
MRPDGLYHVHPNQGGEFSMAKGTKKGGGEMLLVASKAKAVLKSAGCNTAGDALDGLNGWVGWLLEQAAKRAKANGRKTVRAHDFIIM